MTEPQVFEILLVTPPGLEEYLLAEAREQGFKKPTSIPGGVLIRGGWPEVWRANLVLRGTSKVLVRIGEFRAHHLAQLDKHARRFPWANFLRREARVKVEVSTSKGSKIYHSGAAEERLEGAIHAALGAPIAASIAEADVLVKVRIVKNLVVLSLDSSGVPLHKRGHKQALGKAPLRETIAAMTLRACRFSRQEPLLDPMCGSGTYVIEAAAMAANIMAGSNRGFAFEYFASFDVDAVQKMKDDWFVRKPAAHFFGYDQNASVIASAKANAMRAGVSESCHFVAKPLSDLKRPDGPSGLVMVNPPYGQRIGDKRSLFALYGQFGEIMRKEFMGWRVGMVTSNDALAQATKLDWISTSPPIPHGGLKIRLYQASL